MLRKLGKGLTAGVLIAAVGAVGLAASFVSKGTEKAQEVGATNATTTLKLDFSSQSSWISAKEVGIHATDGTNYYYGSSSGTADASSVGTYYTWGNSLSSSKLTLTFSTSADITNLQFFISGSGPTQPYTGTITSGGSYTVSLGSWTSTAIGTYSGGYALSVVSDSATSYSATVNFYVPYQLNATYYDYKYWYIGNGSSHEAASMGAATADSTQSASGCNYVYSVTISQLVSGTSFQVGIGLTELAASAGSDTYSEVWDVASVTVSAAITDNLVAASTSWDSNVAAYEKGLADTWAASFISGTASACTSLAMTSSIWSTYSTSYSAMSTDSTILAAAQADFKSATASASSTAVLAAAAARYDFIYNKYATSLSLANFASRTTSSSALNVSGTLDNASSWTIGLIAGLGVILSGSYFFFLRKKKAE
jgi:hypothetical protein